MSHSSTPVQWRNQNYDEMLKQCVYNFQGTYVDDWNWVTKGVVSQDVGDQGSCSACWAWISAEAIQSLHIIHGHSCPPLSTQDLIDMLHPNSPTCRGGEVVSALECARRAGICEERFYKYYGLHRTRQQRNRPIHTIDGWKCIKDDEKHIIDALHIQPVIVTIPYASFIVDYKEGLLDLSKVDEFIAETTDAGTPCTPEDGENHTVLLVGYGTFWPVDAPGMSINYWIVKNQWNEKWGVKGFGYLIRNSSIFEMEGPLSPKEKELLTWYFTPIVPLKKKDKNEVIRFFDKVDKHLNPSELMQWVTSKCDSDKTLIFLFYSRGCNSKVSEIEEDFTLVGASYEQEDNVLLASINIFIYPCAYRWFQLTSNSDPTVMVFRPVVHGNHDRSLKDALLYSGSQPVDFFSMIKWLGQTVGKGLPYGY